MTPPPWLLKDERLEKTSPMIGLRLSFVTPGISSFVLMPQIRLNQIEVCKTEMRLLKV